MFQHLERGNILYHQRRYAEAEEEYRKILAQDPTNPFALAMIAQCFLETDQNKKALEFAKKSMQLGSESPTIYYILARCFFFNNLPEEALSTIQAGQQIDPSNPDFFLLKSQIAYFRQDWELALQEAERGLALDSEDITLINLRARALVKLNRTEEASATMDYALHQAPDSSFSHANKGWVAIERNEFEQAITHFKEALRLNATNEFAKSGLKEAIKAKNKLYRIVLKYFLWMEKLQEKYRWGFIIGVYILYRIALYLAETSELMAMIMMPLIIAYIIFAFSSWIAMPISNLFLRLHPLGKHALEEEEITASTLVGILAGAAISCFIIYFALGGAINFSQNDDLEIKGYAQIFLLGLMLFLMMIPVGGLFFAEKGTNARKKLTIFTITLAIIGIFALITNLNSLFLIFFLGIFGYGFAANYFISKAAREF
jgi:tetratricopeptide (TPR) repeat protein